MVFEHAQGHAPQWAAITLIAEKIGCAAETLRSWVRQAERDGGRRPGLTTDKRARFKQFERENVELRRANEILRLASAYFAKAELDRRAKCWSGSSTTTGRRSGSSRSARCCRSPRRGTTSWPNQLWVADLTYVAT
jgi:transposase-like protein